MTAAFAATGAQASALIDGDHLIDKDQTIAIERVAAADAQADIFAGIHATQPQETMTVTVAPGALLTITGSIDETYSKDLVRAVNVASGASLTFNGNLAIDVSNNQGSARGFWIEGDSTINGNIHAVARATNQQLAEALTLRGNSHTLTIEGAETYLRAESDGGRVIGVENWGTAGGVINFHAQHTVIEAVTASDPEVYAQGVLAYQSETNFYGNATIVVEGGMSGKNGATYGVDVQCDLGNDYDTSVNFYGALTTIQVTAKGDAYAVRPSGSPGSITFGGLAQITASSTEGSALGVRSQYGAMADFAQDATFNVSAPNGTAIALMAGTYADYVGSIQVGGAVTATVEGKNAEGISVEDMSTKSPEGDGLIAIAGPITMHVAGTENAAAFSSVGALADIQTAGNIDAQVSSESGTVKGITIADGGKATLSGNYHRFTLSTVTGEATGIEILGASALKLEGTTVMTGTTVGLTTETDASLTIGEAASLSVDGEATSAGTVTLERGALLEVGNNGAEASTFASINADAATLAFGAGTYSVNTLSGEGNRVLFTDLANADQVTIASRTHELSFEATGASNDTFANAQAAADALADAIVVSDTPTGKDRLVVNEGAVNDGLVADFDAATGEISNEVVTKNSSVDALGSMAALTFLQWRHELSSVEDRMGDLRSGAGQSGAWARLYGSEMSYGSQNLTSKNTSVELGADLPINAAWSVGATFSYTTGTSDYDAGEGDNDAYGLGAYALWSSESGLFADIAFKYHRLSSDLDVRGADGEKDNNAFGLSSEFGWHLPFAGGAYIEPMIALTYGHIVGEDYSLSNNVRIDEDNMESLTAGAGLRTGFAFPNDRGSFYAKVKVLHDFQGDVDGTTRFGEARNTYSEALGGTYVEFGAGASFHLTNATNAFVNLEKNTGGDVDEKWRWNVGLRHAF